MGQKHTSRLQSGGDLTRIKLHITRGKFANGAYSESNGTLTITWPSPHGKPEKLVLQGDTRYFEKHVDWWFLETYAGSDKPVLLGDDSYWGNQNFPEITKSIKESIPHVQRTNRKSLIRWE